MHLPCCILTMPLENPLHLRKPSQQGWQQLPNHGDLRILAKKLSDKCPDPYQQLCPRNKTIRPWPCINQPAA